MLQNDIIYLMYHELELPGRNPCNNELGYIRYVITENEFRNQLSSLKRLNYVGIDVTVASEVTFEQRKKLVITFDDGCETDLLAAASILSEFNFRATFLCCRRIPGP